MRNTKLDFIGIGARKAGTTWLSRCLDDHPEVQMAKSKETNYFLSDDFLKQMMSDPVLGDPVRYVRVKSLDSEFIKSTAKIKGEFSPYYLYDLDAAYAIKKHNPEVKLVLVLRNPIDAVYSNYWFDRSSGIPGFPDTFENSLEVFPHYIEWFKYSRYVAHYLEIFTQDQLNVIIYDDIKTNPNQILKSLYIYLGVSSNFIPQSLHSRINPGKAVKSAVFASILRKPARILSDYKLRFVIDKLYGYYEKINKVEFQYPSMQHETRVELEKYFLQDIEVLEDLIGVDLTKWKIKEKY